LLWKLSRRCAGISQFSLCSKLCRELEQRLVAFTGCGKLHSAGSAWETDRGNSGETEGRRVAQQTATRFDVIGRPQSAARLRLQDCGGGRGSSKGN
jgi:hypothetical protein